MVDAIYNELADRHTYLQEEISTIYFGGGTPSLLDSDELNKILSTIYEKYSVQSNAEITLEANPEDLAVSKTVELFNLGFNRLSIGVQSFSSEKLKWMNRNHTNEQVLSGYSNARKAGFSNISLDFMYALGDLSYTVKDLKQAINLFPEHISLYGLTIEEGTVFGKWKQSGKLIEQTEESAALQYMTAIKTLQESGYQQYEVSNFCRDDNRSRHNSAYWGGVPYLGVGPGAHSFNKYSRRANIRNNKKYIEGIAKGTLYYDTEVLDSTQLLNERVLTQLRTIGGIDIEAMKRDFQVDLLARHKDVIQQFLDNKLIKVTNNRIALSEQGYLVADEIALQLFSD